MTCDRNRRSTENLPSGFFFSAQTGYLMSEKWTFSVAILMILIPQGGKAAIRFRVGGIWAGDWCNSVGLRRKSEWRQRLRLFVKCISINFLLARSSRFLIYFFKKEASWDCGRGAMWWHGWKALQSKPRRSKWSICFLVQVHWFLLVSDWWWYGRSWA